MSDTSLDVNRKEKQQKKRSYSENEILNNVDVQRKLRDRKKKELFEELGGKSRKKTDVRTASSSESVIDLTRIHNEREEHQKAKGL